MFTSEGSREFTLLFYFTDVEESSVCQKEFIFKWDFLGGQLYEDYCGTISASRAFKIIHSECSSSHNISNLLIFFKTEQIITKKLGFYIVFNRISFFFVQPNIIVSANSWL